VEEPLFPDKAKMVRSANFLFVTLAVAPVLYLVTAVLLTFGGPGLGVDPSIIPWLFLGLALFSLANIGVTIFVQTSAKMMSERARYDPIGRTYLLMSLGAVLSEAHAIYGLVLTLLSGSIFYGIGFTIVAWASLWWVWKRFKQSLASPPNA
jgi:F0F1-type ATP synthase membrane subunit c/vacuolar-type H+-ATPase subunit K